ncbi:MAG: zf-HC2 domain-containing protein [Streptosporangiaceae bacterium]
MSHLGQRISALIDGELSDSERDRVLAHIAGCDACRQEAVALRALKRRMHSLGEAMVDAALTGRLMAMAMAMPPDGRPWTARPWRPRGAFPAARMLTAGILASTVAGLGAAAFFAGGEQQAPGPKVTPAVDTFLVQHAIVTGDLPVTPLAGGTAGNPGSPAPATGSSRVAAGVSASGIAAAVAVGAQARSASRRFARGQASSGQASIDQVASGPVASAQAGSAQAGSAQAGSSQAGSSQAGSSQAGSMMRRGLRQPVPVVRTPVPVATASASPGP